MRHSMEELIQFIQRETSYRQRALNAHITEDHIVTGKEVSMLIDVSEHLIRAKNQKMRSL